MKGTSQWQLHPSLVDSMEHGLSFEGWLAGRTPVVSYARVSRGVAGGGKGAGRQHLNNDDAAAELGWAVVCRFTDDGITASDPSVERPAFMQMVRDIRVRRIEGRFRVCGIIAVEEERVARLADDYQYVCRALAMEADGCLYWVDKRQLVDVRAALESGTKTSLSEADEGESKRMSRRRLRSVRDHAREGRVTGGQRRFGWQGPDGTTNRRTNTQLDLYESKYLRAAIEMALAGTSWTVITDWLTGESVPTVRGSRWAVDTVQSMVTNPAICGYRIVDGDLVRDRESGRQVIGKWETIATPQEWEKLIERCDRWHSPGGMRPTYKQTHAERSKELGTDCSSRERKDLAEASRKYLLAGFLRCGYTAADGETCGSMGGQPPRGTNRQPSYRCSASKCRKVGRRTDLVDEHVEVVAQRALIERYGNAAPDRRPYPGEEQLERLRSCETSTVLTGMQIRDLEEDRKEFCAQQATYNLLAGFSAERWASFDVRQKRLAIAAVVRGDAFSRGETEFA